jgi:hypothetical protein
VIPVFNRFIKLSNWGKVVAELYGMNDMLSFWGVALAIASLANLAKLQLRDQLHRQTAGLPWLRAASLSSREGETN